MADVDFAVSYSSWEHDGLGRYGDPIDPWGDIKAMQRAACYVKQGDQKLHFRVLSACIVAWLLLDSHHLATAVYRF